MSVWPERLAALDERRELAAYRRSVRYAGPVGGYREPAVQPAVARSRPAAGVPLSEDPAVRLVQLTRPERYARALAFAEATVKEREHAQMVGEVGRLARELEARKRWRAYHAEVDERRAAERDARDPLGWGRSFADDERRQRQLEWARRG